jgi:hypothetical protein
MGKQHEHLQGTTVRSGHAETTRHALLACNALIEA